MITQTDIIILRTINHGESSRISTVLSKEHGKISLIGKGAREPKSKLSGMMQPGNILSVVYYYKASRSIQLLAEASYLHRLDRLNRDVSKMAVSMSTLELINQLVHENEVNEPVFRFVHNFLSWLNAQEEVQRTVFPYLQLRLASILGLELQMEAIETGTKRGYLNIESGTVSSRPASNNSIPLGRIQLQFIRQSLSSKNGSVLQKELSNSEIRSLVDYLDRYFRYHLEGLRPRSSDAIFDQILKD